MVLFINIVGSKLFIPGKLQYMGHDYDHHLMSLVSSKEWQYIIFYLKSYLFSLGLSIHFLTNDKPKKLQSSKMHKNMLNKSITNWKDFV